MYGNYEFDTELDERFVEAFADCIDTVAVERRKDADGEDVALPAYWEDTLTGIVDDCLPTYYSEIAKLWLDCGCNEPDDIEINSDATIIEQMQLANWEYGYRFLMDLAGRYGFSD